METSLILRKLGLANVSTSYSEKANAFLSSGYTSTAGNTYFSAIRIAEGILIKDDIGTGYCRTFLNGIRIYSLKDKTLLAEKSFHSHFYSKDGVKRHAKSMLLDVLKEAALEEGWSMDEDQAQQEIARIIDKSFSTNQLTMLKNHSGKLLNG